MELYISFPSTSIPENFDKRSSMILPLILEQIKRSHISGFNYLFDCYSMTTIESRTDTYYLAKNAGIPHTKPIALTGQGGTEVAQCLKFLARDDSFSQAICIASQSIPTTYSIENANNNTYAIGVAAIVMIISNQRVNRFSSFKIGLVELFQNMTYLQNNIESIKNSINKICGKIERVIIQNNFDINIDVASSLFDTGLIYNRKIYKNVNFGCADAFITLEDFVKNNQNKIEKNVLLFLIGYSGTIALIILERI